MGTESGVEFEADIYDDSSSVKKIHRWRICPIGKHLVREHTLHIPPSKTHPDGMIVVRHQHCADNPSKKDLLSFDEIQEISSAHFSSLIGLPNKEVLTEFENSDKYDELIRGWVYYWNDIFNPQDQLNPNLIKALTATESSFRLNPKKNRSAYGLMQITNDTLKILGDHHGELKNYIINAKKKDILEPSANICCGVRWLFIRIHPECSPLRGRRFAPFKNCCPAIFVSKKKQPLVDYIVTQLGLRLSQIIKVI
jgi:hypothetical protein